MREMTIGAFLERLASADPTPGGGAAAALAGALAAALGAMVARLSAGKGGDDDAFLRTAQTADRARDVLLDLTAQDAEAFEAVMRALRLPRATEEQKQARQAAVQAALPRAAEVPLRVMEETMRVFRLLPDLARTGNPNAVSDVAVGALLAYAAVHGALHNVRINAAAIKDATLAAGLQADAEALGREAARLRDEVCGALRERR
ncbi:MAG: cyclodeaminase/cyclohydrolase family protein [Armatimonadota bacterium]|nr:cyclodeaminase/cyclohydrolase family protein [Armatimonadota bacterium]MDR7451613.1 cyclodeaminase/cyclohydrolase family protein [Armatimonadota bacterium]MDR7467667.1 cyclodeaminase/cyclohydrolase family protein [Armatimonadota bacterium]MDR7492582.1 cyclodeaminase/cyclohydrolase family protein [Armatimonadota bacterium]MDR7499950.1 cyclodeaminase/cyclohydrolase family protein [Armatimonadota bacterium]